MRRPLYSFISLSLYSVQDGCKSHWRRLPRSTRKVEGCWLPVHGVLLGGSHLPAGQGHVLPISHSRLVNNSYFNLQRRPIFRQPVIFMKSALLLVWAASLNMLYLFDLIGFQEALRLKKHCKSLRVSWKLKQKVAEYLAAWRRRS